MPIDKIKHLVAGMFISLMVSLLTSMPWLGVVASIIIGAGKEYYDSFHPEHTVDKWDFAVTALGGLIGAAIVGIFL